MTRFTMTATMVAAGLVGGLAMAQQAARTVPVGTQLDLLLSTELTSETAKADDRFEASTIADFKQNGQVVIPAGAIAHGFVGSVRAATRANHQGQLTLSFDELLVGEQSFKLRGSVVSVLNPKRRPTSTRDGAPVDLADPGAMPLLATVVVAPGGSINSMTGGNVLLQVGVVLRVSLSRAIEIKTGLTR